MSWEEIKERIVWNKPHKTLEAELPTIKEITYEPYKCEDCPRILTQKRVVEHSMRQTPYLHAKHTCKACQLIKNPETGEFDLKTEQYSAILHNIRRRKHKY